MFKNFFKSHQYKIIWSAPIIFLVIINSTGSIGVGNIFYFQQSSNKFMTVDETTEITLAMRTSAPINAMGGAVHFSTDILEMTGLSRISSVVDLWTEEPSYTKSENVLRFSGGMIGTKTETPTDGTVFVMNVLALKSGLATITLEDGQLLASNGEGTNIISGVNTLKLYVRERGAPSPDVNGDGELSVSDVNALYLKTFRTYDKRYDLNGDTKVSWGDVRLLLALF